MNIRCLGFGVLLLAGPVSAQEAVTYRDRTTRRVETAKGRIESESLAGIKIDGKTIPAGDVATVEYDVPGGLKLDLLKAIQCETERKFDEAAKEYRRIANDPVISNNKPLRRYYDYKVAWITAGKADDGPEGVKLVIEALAKFAKDHPDAWERVPLARFQVRICLDAEPPDTNAARKVYEELAAAPGAPAELKAECTFAVIDLLLARNAIDEAKRLLSGVSRDVRAPLYQIALAVDPGKPDDTVKKLEEQLVKADDAIKPTIYNLMGDAQRLDPKTEKDALFSYLKVDAVYNHDRAETMKAQGRIAELFRKMNQEDRAKSYRDKARGR